MKFTRRKFLGSTLAGSLAMGALSSGNDEAAPVAAASAVSYHENLRAAMDEIIPARDGMPAASEAGGVEYLDPVGREEPQIAADLKEAIDALGRLSQERLQAEFVRLPSPQRVEILSALEQSSPDLFARLRDHVYESYYTQPRVWKLIGYDFYPTNAAGPAMKPFDESVLNGVKKRPKLYREVEG